MKTGRQHTCRKSPCRHARHGDFNISQSPRMPVARKPPTFGCRSGKIAMSAYCSDIQQLTASSSIFASLQHRKTSVFIIKTSLFSPPNKPLLHHKTNGFAMQTRLFCTATTPNNAQKHDSSARQPAESRPENSKTNFPHVKKNY